MYHNIIISQAESVALLLIMSGGLDGLSRDE